MAKLLLLLALAFAACPQSPKCPLHENNYGHFKRADYVDGKRVNTYECPRGPHTFQIVCN